MDFWTIIADLGMHWWLQSVDISSTIVINYILSSIVDPLILLKM